MAKVPVRKLTKAQIVWLAENNCHAHSTNYFSHYGCFLAENPDGAPAGLKERVGFFDIESSNFKANFGIVYCYAIKDGDSDEILQRYVTPHELKTCLDKNVVEQCIKDLKKFDRIVTYYGTYFDIPFVRTRALFHGLKFPEYQDLLHTDVYYMVRGKLCLNRNSQEIAHRLICGKSNKTHHAIDAWTRGMTGNKEAMDYMVEHNRIDVVELERLFHVLQVFTAKNRRSV